MEDTDPGLVADDPAGEGNRRRGVRRSPRVEGGGRGLSRGPRIARRWCPDCGGASDGCRGPPGREHEQGPAKGKAVADDRPQGASSSHGMSVPALEANPPRALTVVTNGELRLRRPRANRASTGLRGIIVEAVPVEIPSEEQESW